MPTPFDPIDSLESIEDPNVAYILTKRKILEDLGIKYIGQLFFVDAADVQGIDADKYEKSLIALRKYLSDASGFGIDAYSLLQRTSKSIGYIHTGSLALDYVLGGGIRTGIITEFAGRYHSGKTQLSLTASVAAQINGRIGEKKIFIQTDSSSSCYPVDENGNKLLLDELDKIGFGLGKRVIYIDSEGSFEPLRVRSIARRFGLDPDEVLKNIIVYRVSSVAEQFEAAYSAGMRVPIDNVGLIVVDSLTALFRSEFSGREQLAARQQSLNKFVRILQRIAELYNVAVIVTNQVMDVPDARYTSGDAFGVKAVGGNVVAHNVGIRMMLDSASAQAERADKEMPIRRGRIVDSSYLPPREARFAISDGGIVDIELKSICKMIVSDYYYEREYITLPLSRIILPPSEKALSGKKRSEKMKKTKKAKELKESA